MPLKKPNEKDDLRERIEDQIDNSDLRKKYILPEAKTDESYAFSVQFPKEHKKLLEKHYKQQGISFSAGIRMLIYKYMKDNDIH